LDGMVDDPNPVVGMLFEPRQFMQPDA